MFRTQAVARKCEVVVTESDRSRISAERVMNSLSAEVGKLRSRAELDGARSNAAAALTNTGGKNGTFCVSTFYIKKIILPRQARDKHMERTQKETFSCSHQAQLRPRRGDPRRQGERNGEPRCCSCNACLRIWRRWRLGWWRWWRWEFLCWREFGGR